MNTWTLKIIACFLSASFAYVASAQSAKPAVLAVIDPVPKTEFEGERRLRIQDQLRQCPNCQIVNITPYTSAGDFDPNGISRVLDQVPRENSVVLVLWNKKFEAAADKEIVEKIKGLANQGVLFVATAGKPEAKGATLGLRRTLWGQTPQVVIIGELAGGERLLPGTFFGPEMLTAIRPSEALGQDAAALMFSARLVSNLKDKKSNEWVDFLRNKKATSKRMWPNLDEFFGR